MYNNKDLNSLKNYLESVSKQARQEQACVDQIEHLLHKNKDEVKVFPAGYLKKINKSDQWTCFMFLNGTVIFEKIRNFSSIEAEQWINSVLKNKNYKIIEGNILQWPSSNVRKTAYDDLNKHYDFFLLKI